MNQLLIPSFPREARTLQWEKGVGTMGLIVSGTLTGSHQAACELGSGSGPGERTTLWTQIPASPCPVEKSLPKSQLRKFLPQREAQPFANFLMPTVLLAN